MKYLQTFRTLHLQHIRVAAARWDERGPLQFRYLLMYQVVICSPAVQHQLSVTVMIYKQNILSAAESLFHIKCSSQLAAATLAPRHGEVNLC